MLALSIIFQHWDATRIRACQPDRLGYSKIVRSTPMGPGSEGGPMEQQGINSELMGYHIPDGATRTGHHAASPKPPTASMATAPSSTLAPCSIPHSLAPRSCLLRSPGQFAPAPAPYLSRSVNTQLFNPLDLLVCLSGTTRASEDCSLVNCGLRACGCAIQVCYCVQFFSALVWLLSL